MPNYYVAINRPPYPVQGPEMEVFTSDPRRTDTLSPDLVGLLKVAANSEDEATALCIERLFCQQEDAAIEILIPKNPNPNRTDLIRLARAALSAAFAAGATLNDILFSMIAPFVIREKAPRPAGQALSCVLGRLVFTDHEMTVYLDRFGAFSLDGPDSYGEAAVFEVWDDYMRLLICAESDNGQTEQEPDVIVFQERKKVSDG